MSKGGSRRKFRHLAGNSRIFEGLCPLIIIEIRAGNAIRRSDFILKPLNRKNLYCELFLGDSIIRKYHRERGIQ